jgi:hypothetical protein
MIAITLTPAPLLCGALACVCLGVSLGVYVASKIWRK